MLTSPYLTKCSLSLQSTQYHITTSSLPRMSTNYTLYLFTLHNITSHLQFTSLTNPYTVLHLSLPYVAFTSTCIPFPLHLSLIKVFQKDIVRESPLSSVYVARVIVTLMAVIVITVLVMTLKVLRDTFSLYLRVFLRACVGKRKELQGSSIWCAAASIMVSGNDDE